MKEIRDIFKVEGTENRLDTAPRIQEDDMIQTTVDTRQVKGIHYTVSPNNRLRKYTPWLGDVFSIFYDSIMRRSVFPGKFGADIQKHYRILRS